jgi:hypothetical protein
MGIPCKGIFHRSPCQFLCVCAFVCVCAVLVHVLCSGTGSGSLRFAARVPSVQALLVIVSHS